MSKKSDFGSILNILNLVLVVFIILGTLAILIDLFSYPGRAILNFLLMIPEVIFVVYCMHYVDKGSFIKPAYFIAAFVWAAIMICTSFIIIVVELSGKLYICT